MHPAIVFLLILVSNVFGFYWIAATPELCAAIGHFFDFYVMPGILAFGLSVVLFWFYLKLRYISHRLAEVRGWE